MANWGLKVADFSYEDCVADNVVMPDLYMLFKKDGSGNIDVIFDDKSAQSIGNYIEASEKEAALMSDWVDRCLGDVNKLMVWGVGTHTKHLLDAGLDKREVVCFIDSNSRYKGAALNGVEVIMPEMIKGDCPILVSTHSYQDEIMDLIRNKLGLSNEILALYD